VYGALGLVHRAAQHRTEALSWLRKAMEFTQAGTTPRGLSALKAQAQAARAAFEAGETAEAERIVRQALGSGVPPGETDYVDAQLRSVLGRVLLDRGQTEDAWHELEVARRRFMTFGGELSWLDRDWVAANYEALVVAAGSLGKLPERAEYERQRSEFRAVRPTPAAGGDRVP
jgi:ATP/maltotriose-dependent transcriptional regulator MalT